MKSLKRCMFVVAGTLAMALGASVAASSPPAAPAATENTSAVSGPAMWKVADEDTTIYLFGTVHALPPGTRWMDDRIERALHVSDEFVTEVDLADAKSGKPAMVELALLPQGVTLRALLRPEERGDYEAAVTNLGFPAEAFDRFKPWYAAMMLSLLPMTKKGFTADNGAEAVLEARLPSGSRKKALESVNSQLQLFDSLPPETQIAYLMEVSRGLPAMDEQLGRIIDQWLRGDADGLAALLKEETSDPILLESLLLERNRNWAGWIADRMKQPGTVFVAVGAGHLAGSGSVQDVLAQSGINSTRVH